MLSYYKTFREGLSGMEYLDTANRIVIMSFPERSHHILFMSLVKANWIAHKCIPFWDWLQEFQLQQMNHCGPTSLALGFCTRYKPDYDSTFPSAPLLFHLFFLYFWRFPTKKSPILKSRFQIQIFFFKTITVRIPVSIAARDGTINDGIMYEMWSLLCHNCVLSDNFLCSWLILSLRIGLLQWGVPSGFRNPSTF